jgi:hypothetical protein
MNEKSFKTSLANEKILRKIRSISEDLTQATENCGITTKQLIEIIHRQTRELSQIYHQLCHLYSEKGGKH